jgi:hypothetical protein
MASRGGALLLNSNGVGGISVTIYDCEFVSNTALPFLSALSAGGAVLAIGIGLNVSSTVVSFVSHKVKLIRKFDNNNALSPSTIETFGGALYLENPLPTVIQSSQFNGNIAVLGSAAAFITSGDASSLQFTECNATGNTGKTNDVVLEIDVNIVA